MSTYSDEHKKYLKKLRKEKVIVFIFRILIISIFLIAWELLSDYKIINSFTSSSPIKATKTIIELFRDGSLIKHIGVTLYEVLISFFISSIVGMITAIILWSNKIVSKILDPYLTILNSLPKVALGPLIIIWVGASTSSIIFMALLINTFITIINIYNSFISTDKNYIILLKSLKASKFKILTNVVLPSNYLNIISALKINVSMSLIGVIMGELLVSKNGLGYLIMYGSQVFNIDLVIASVIILGIISYLMYFIIEKIEIYIKNKRS